MGGEGGRPGLLLAPAQDEGHRLATHTADRDLAVLGDRAEQRPSLFASRLQPAFNQPGAFGGEIQCAAAACVADQDRPIGQVEVGDIEPSRLGSPHTYAVDDGQHGGIAAAGKGGTVGVCAIWLPQVPRPAAC